MDSTTCSGHWNSNTKRKSLTTTHQRVASQISPCFRKTEKLVSIFLQESIFFFYRKPENSSDPSLVVPKI